jgi:arabinogalactan endo-1,4-beta-galactosidase
MKITVLLLTLCLGMRCCFAEAGHVVDLHVGSISLIDGYQHEPGPKRDSIIGEFTRADGKFRIGYDIGGNAGYHVHPMRKANFSWYREQTINGSFACIGIIEDKGVKYLRLSIYSSPSAPTGEAANFGAVITGQEDLAEMVLVITAYKWKAKS